MGLGFNVGIAVIHAPVVTDVCNGCGGGMTRREVLAAVFGALAATVVVGAAAVVGARAYRRRGQGGLLGARGPLQRPVLSTDPHLSSVPYMSSPQ